MSKGKYIELGEDKFNRAWLLNVTEQHAVNGLGKALKNPNRVRKAWKIAHGLTVPDYIKAENDEKPKRKRTPKKKQDKPS